jgi:hypothetical protein
MNSGKFEEKKLNFLSEVYKKTINGLIDWQQSAQNDVFLAPIKNKYTIKIGHESFYGIIFRFIDENDITIFDVSISQDGNKEVDERFEGATTINQVLNSIYENAKMTVLKADQKIDEASKFLSEDDPF